MLRIIALSKDMQLVKDLSLDDLNTNDFYWFWADFNQPTEEEIKLLGTFFHFHPLAIEDCIQYVQRPKLDHYNGYHFFVFHSLEEHTFEAREVDVFISEKFMVSFHNQHLREIETVYSEVVSDPNVRKQGTAYILYRLLDKLVDNYFPTLYQIEDRVNELDTEKQAVSLGNLMDELFQLRGTLLKTRHTIVPMSDLLYRILNSTHLEIVKGHMVYFTDIYDHLLKLSEIIESNREITADIRDSYLSLNSNRMNTIMMTLTVITTIFMPLTFIVGLYGMNFEYMPELQWRYGYFYVLGLMSIIGAIMFYWFSKKGWFRD